MEILVCVKQVLDMRLPVEVTSEGAIAQREPRLVFTLNPPDRAALEEAMRLRAEIEGCRVTALTVGPERAAAVLVHCLGRGVDEVVHLRTGGPAPLDSFEVARALSVEIRRRSFDLILCGDRSEDDGASEVGPVLAEFLDVAQVTGVVKLTVSPAERRLVAERKLERGYRQVIEASLPALITVDAALREPRYVTRRALQSGAARWAQHGTVVPLDDGAPSGGGRPLRRVVGLAPPRPRPKRTARPAGGMSAEDRLGMMMGGGMPSKSSQRVSGGAEKLADDIASFLREKGLLP